MKQQEQQVSGVVLLDKPSGLSSNAAVQRVRKVFDRAKAGHTGTLDPLATGLLPICLGEATKFSHCLLDAAKSYEATAKLGWRSTTGDAEGELSEDPVPEFDSAMLRQAVNALSGQIEQIPPMYSALKVGGRALHTLARKGIEVERQPRKIHIFQLLVTRPTGDTLAISVTCSKGTYVRVLAEDLGRLLGGGAYLTALRRTAIGSCNLADACSLEELESLPPTRRAERLKPVDFLLATLPSITLGEDEANRFGNGMSIPVSTRALGEVRVYQESGRFLGLGERLDNGQLKPKRLLSKAS